MKKYRGFCFVFISVILLTAMIIPGCGNKNGPSNEGDSFIGGNFSTDGVIQEDVIVASHMNDFLFNKELINSYFDQSLVEMSMFDFGSSARSSNFNSEGKIEILMTSTLLYKELSQSTTRGMPPGYSGPLPSGGSINAPSGACGPAAANATVQFVTGKGDIVTPELLESINLDIIPAGLVMHISSNNLGNTLISVEEINSDELRNKMKSLIDMNNPAILRDLATPQGWNTHFWSKLNYLQEPATSLLDYHLWNIMNDIESSVVDQFRQELQSYRVPQMVLDAFDKSNKYGWFASKEPTSTDNLARIEIEAILSGSVSGTVSERRDFSIVGAGKMPEFGIQTGEGTIVFESPEFGTFTFEVEIALDQFDEQGRAIGGEVRGSDSENGYSIIFIYNADGSREGTLSKNGTIVGTMHMAVDQERFQNYVSVDTGDSIELKIP